MGYYNVMIENRSILSELAEAFGEILSTLGLMAIVTCFFALLFAPAFGGVIENSMKNKSGVLTDFPEIERKMKYVRTVLWTIAILAWALMAGLNLKF